MNNRLKVFLLFAGFILFILGSLKCKDDITNFDISQIVFPAKNVSYHDHVEPIFLHVCAIPGGCHAGENPAGKLNPLNLETYEDFRQRLDIINFSTPENSRLILALKGKLSGVEQMPINRPKLNDNQINGMIIWIKEGVRGDN